MKKTYPVEFVYQVLSLIVAVILVHALYVAVVRPRADSILAEQAALMQADPDYVQERSVWVIIRDFEQEACFVLMLWAMAIMILKGVQATREHRLLQEELVPVAEGTKILPEDAREYARQVESLPASEQKYLLPRTLLAAFHRFSATRNIQDVSTTALAITNAESERLESELSMVRYIAWAIPSIGFIGTVRGIGEALGQAHKAVEGDIAGVTRSLGVAFNSTFIALLISIVLMFLLHQLQLHQERLVLETETYLDEHLIRHLQVGEKKGLGVTERNLS
jgi:biopolymer transport protein ExbB/TolQ